MSGDSLLDVLPDDDLAIEPEPELAVEIELEPEPEPQLPAVVTDTAPVTATLTEILPADFKLPALIKFIPNKALRVAADDAARYALALAVEGAEGLTRADLALTAVRTSLNAITAHLEEPIGIANALHKGLTTVRAEWQAQGKAAVETVGRRIYTEQKRLEGIAAEERRKAQDEANRLAREAAQREAKAAEKAQAPAPVVEELKRQAQTATAPPVATPAATPALSGSSPVTTWKSRIVGTPGSDEPNPKMADLTTTQRAEVLKLFKAVVEGAAPMALFELNWSTMNGRAKAEKSAMNLPGIEAFEEGSLRAKGQRRQ